MATPYEVINPVTISNYIRSKWDNFTVIDQTFSRLKQLGNIRTGQSGLDVRWPVRGGRYRPQVTAGFQDVSSLLNAKKMDIQATLGWGEIMNGDGISRDEWLKNNGQAALISLTQFRIPHMADGLINMEYNSSDSSGGLAAQLLRSNGGTYTGSGAPFYGLPSIFDVSTVQGTPDASAQGETTGATIVVGDKFGSVYNKTYAGFSTAYNGLSAVMQDAQPKTWAPLLVNTGSTGFGTSGSASAGWNNNGLKILSETIAKQAWGDGHDPDIGILSTDMFASLRNQLSAKQTIYIERPPSSEDPLGIGGSASYAMHDGVKIYQSQHMLTANGYILSMKDIYLDVLRTNTDMGSAAGGYPGTKNLKGMDDMFDVMIENDPNRRGTTISITVRGQFRINPKYQARLFDYKFA